MDSLGLGALEREAREILWANPNATANAVLRRMDRLLAYKTVMTSFLERVKEGRSFSYSPTVSRRAIEKSRIELFLYNALSSPATRGDVILSSLLAALTRHDPALLDELERPGRFAMLSPVDPKNKATFKSVGEYIASQPESVHRILQRVRNAIRKAVPQAAEVISYKMPAYRIPEGPLLYFAGWKQHYSLYPASAELRAAFKEELAPYVVSKGTIRFPISQPVPVKLIAAIAMFRVTEISGRVRVNRPRP